MNALTRIKFVLNLPEVRQDGRAIGLIEAVLAASLRYVSAVSTMETVLLSKEKLAADELKESTASLDRSRTLAHNALIDSIRICNRYLFSHFENAPMPVGGVFSGNPVHLTDDSYRAYIGDWAGEVVNELFIARRR